MGCGCGVGGQGRLAEQERVDEAASALGLREVVVHSREVGPVREAALGYWRKARRAESLGYADEVVQLYSGAAARESAQGLRQVDAVIARLDARIAEPDWSDLLVRTGDVFRERGGPAVIEEMKERFRMDLLELDSITPDLALAALEVANETFDAVTDQGLDGAIQRLRDALSGERRLFVALVDAGAASRTPRAINQRQIACITVAVALAAVALVACMFIPYCWCCLTPLFAAILAVQLAACAVFL